LPLDDSTVSVSSVSSIHVDDVGLVKDTGEKISYAGADCVETERIELIIVAESFLKTEKEKGKPEADSTSFRW
jgi:hypothetical protein